MNKFLLIWIKWLAYRNRKLEEEEKERERVKELETLRRLQEKKKQLDRLRDESHK